MIGCPETSYSLRNSSGERSSHLISRGSLKSRNLWPMTRMFRNMRFSQQCSRVSGLQGNDAVWRVKWFRTILVSDGMQTHDGLETGQWSR